MNQVKTENYKGKVVIVARGKEKQKKIELISNAKKQPIANIDWEWYEEKISSTQKISALLSEFNLIPNHLYPSPYVRPNTTTTQQGRVSRVGTLTPSVPQPFLILAIYRVWPHAIHNPFAD